MARKWGQGTSMRAHRRRVKAALNKLTVHDIRKFLTRELSKMKR